MLETGSVKGGFCKYWTNGSNCFDGTLVVTGTLDLYILPLLIHGKKGGAVSTLRLLRMLRVLRILRLFKVFRELSDPPGFPQGVLMRDVGKRPDHHPGLC